MYCLRSYIPLLLLPIPLSLSPVHLTLLLALTFVLNRPCIYCSLLLVILFASSCHWSGQCLLDFSYRSVEEGGAGIATLWLPRLYSMNASMPLMNATETTGSDSLSRMAGNVVTDMAGLLLGLRPKTPTALNASLSSSLENIKNVFGKEWTLPCIGAKVVL